MLVYRWRKFGMRVTVITGQETTGSAESNDASLAFTKLGIGLQITPHQVFLRPCLLLWLVGNGCSQGSFLLLVQKPLAQSPNYIPYVSLEMPPCSFTYCWVLLSLLLQCSPAKICRSRNALASLYDLTKETNGQVAALHLRHMAVMVLNGKSCASLI